MQCPNKDSFMKLCVFPHGESEEKRAVLPLCTARDVKQPTNHTNYCFQLALRW